MSSIQLKEVTRRVLAVGGRLGKNVADDCFQPAEGEAA